MIYVTQEMRLTNKRTLSLTGYWFSFNRKKSNRNLQQQANSLQLEKNLPMVQTFKMWTRLFFSSFSAFRRVPSS